MNIVHQPRTLLFRGLNAEASGFRVVLKWVLQQPRTLLVRGRNAGMSTAAGADEPISPRSPSTRDLRQTKRKNTPWANQHNRLYTTTTQIILGRKDRSCPFNGQLVSCSKVVMRVVNCVKKRQLEPFPELAQTLDQTLTS